MSQAFKIIDVRTKAEFDGGNVAGSINIPLNELVDRIDEIKAINQPILFCCLSGGRSGQATAYCQAQGIDCQNGGGWMEVNYKMSQNGVI